MIAMANGVDLPEGLIQKAANEMLAAGDLSERIRAVDGEPKPDMSRKDVFVMVWQLGAKRWKAKTVEDITLHGPVTAYAWSEAAASGCEMRFAIAKALLQAGIYNTWDEAVQHVLHRVDVRVADVNRLK